MAGVPGVEKADVGIAEALGRHVGQPRPQLVLERGRTDDARGGIVLPGIAAVGEGVEDGLRPTRRLRVMPRVEFVEENR
jgi:hypothetical protein